MNSSSLGPEYRMRDHVSTCLRTMQPRLEAQGVRHVAVFGSVARGDDGVDSDVDLVLDLDPAANVDLLELASIHEMLTLELRRSVDIMTRRVLRPDRHADIFEDLYEVF